MSEEKLSDILQNAIEAGDVQDYATVHMKYCVDRAKALEGRVEELESDLLDALEMGERE